MSDLDNKIYFIYIMAELAIPAVALGAYIYVLIKTKMQKKRVTRI